MITCDECRTKLVTLFDNEDSEGDRALVSAHLKDCARCRAFQRNILGIRQAFVSVPVPGPPETVGEALLRQVRAEALPMRDRESRERGVGGRWRRGWPRLAWAGGLAGFCLVVLCCTVCLILARQVADLKQELRVAKSTQGRVIASGVRSSTNDTGKGPKILSPEETGEQLRKLVRVGSYYAGQRPFQIRTVQTDIDIFDEATPERLLALAEFWKDRAKRFVEGRAAALREFQDVADPAFDPIIQSYIEALEAYDAGEVNDSIMLLRKAEELWETIESRGAREFPGRILVPRETSGKAPSA